jgi:mRNA interferase MazF
MRRGEIWQVDFGPAVVVSNDRANATASRLGRGVVTVVPVTSNVARIYPFQVLLPAATTGLAVDSKAQAEQIRSVATERLRRRIGRVPPSELAQLDDALRLHLEL